MEFYDEVVEIKNKSTKLINQKSEEHSGATAMATTTATDAVQRNIQDEEEAKRVTQKRPTSSLPRHVQKINHISSDSDSSDSEDVKLSAEGFNYKQWEGLSVSNEIKELYQFIPRFQVFLIFMHHVRSTTYSAPKIDIQYNLHPFIPDFIPAVGDIDAFLKVLPPNPFSEKSRIIEFVDRLGYEILDEPCGEQSVPALLHMKLRSISTSSSRTPGPPPAISKSSKDTEKWISEVQALHANQPYPINIQSKTVPDIDALMVEWPTKMEQMLNNIGFPNAQLDCSLKFYIEMMCSLFDIPITRPGNQVDYLYALNTLFNLYLAIKNPVE